MKLNDNRKLMNSGNDVIANEWNVFFSVYAVQLLINNGTSLWKPAHCVRGEKKDPLDLHRTLNIVLLLVFMSGALYEFLGRSWWACPGRSVVNGITNRGGAFMRLPARVGQ